MNSKKVVENILSLGAGEIVSRALAFIGTAYVARELGPDAFGILGFALALSLYFSLAVQAGFNELGAREIAKRPADALRIAASVVLIRLLLALLAFLTLALLASALPKATMVKVVVVLAGLSFFPLALDTSWVYKGLERNRRVALALVVGHILYVATVVAVVHGPNDVLLVPVALFLAELSTAGFLAVMLFPVGLIRVDLQEGWRILRASWFPTLTRLLRTLIYTFDVVFIEFILGEREVGIYAAAYRICYLLVAIAVATHVSYLPALTRAASEGFKRLAEFAGRSLEVAAAISAPAVVGGIVLASPLLAIVFGNQYVQGTIPFRWLLLSVGFLFLNGTVRNILLVTDRLKLEMLIMAFGAALNIILNLILIPRYGLTAAAFTTALAEGFILLAGLITIFRIGVPVTLWPFARVLVPAAVMGVALVGIGASARGLPFSMAFGSVVYVLAMLLFRTVPRDLHPHLQGTAVSVRRLREALWRA